MKNEAEINKILQERIKVLESKNSILEASYIELHKENETRFKELFENIPVAYQSLDEEGRFLDVNKYWLEMLGYEREEVTGKLFGDLWTDDTRALFPVIFEGFKDACWINNAELQVKNKDGSIIDVVLTGRIQKELDLKFGKTHCILHNITKQKENQRALKRSIDTKDRFFSIIAHDLRGPISNLSTYLNLLSDKDHDMSERKKEKAIKSLSKSATHVFNLLENLLTWAKSQTGELVIEKKQLNMTSLITEAISIIKLQAMEKEITITTDLDKGMEIHADHNMIRTVIINLLSNALKFSYPKGNINIKTHNNAEEVTLKISDSGKGIPKAEQKKLFKLNTAYTSLGTKNEKGSGLGLILCKEFIEQNNGKIRFESTEGLGTDFFITIKNRISQH